TTGGRPRLLGITKRGNKYLRMLLIHGARAALPLLRDGLTVESVLWTLIKKTARRCRSSYQDQGANLHLGRGNSSETDGVDGPRTASACQDGAVVHLIRRPSAMQIATIGLDLAKHVFQLHGVGPDGCVILRKKLRRTHMMPFFASLPPCLIGMET